MAAVPVSYNYGLSTEANWGTNTGAVGGVFRHLRERLDYSYHKKYAPERESVQDGIVQDAMKAALRKGTAGKKWLVFTAGGMGVGKGYSMNKLVNGLLRLDDVAVADPDAIRMKLPEYQQYLAVNPFRAGELTQKESGYISELIQHAALERGRDLVVDGSLRDTTHAFRSIERVRKCYPDYRIAIVHVTASPQVVYARARKRVGRFVPTSVIADSLAKSPESVDRLSRAADLVLRVDNTGPVPQLLSSVPDAAIFREATPRAIRGRAASWWCQETRDQLAPLSRVVPLLFYQRAHFDDEQQAVRDDFSEA
ncbi:hypothetical protein DIPPA_09730 [Diplonema papillatum]|nr:hypothetical protein DIPPA_09730 [Diplonema papillatum]